MKIVAKDVNIRFGNSYLYSKDINLEIEKGKIYIFEGPSGSGKTTFVKIISFLQKPSKGEIYWGDKKIESLEQANKIRTKYIALIPSNFIFVENLTAEENLKIVALANNIDYTQAIERLIDTLEFGEKIKEISLKNLLRKKVHELSNGQKEIISIARALLLNSPFILGDETFRSFRDLDMENIIEKVLQSIKEEGRSLFLITHREKTITAIKKVLGKENIFYLKIENNEIKYTGV